MKKVFNITLITLLILLILPSCHKQEEFQNDPYGNFDALWTIMDEHYCFFQYKKIDWKEVGERYRAKVKNNMTV